MRCDLARRLASDRLDGALAEPDEDALARHLATCPACTGYAARLERVRRQLRLAGAGDAPDLAPAVVGELSARQRGRPRTRPITAAAVFVAAFALAAAAVGIGAPPPATARDIADIVAAAQRDVHRLAAEVTVTERGWHPDVPVRRYEGRLRYAAPEAFALELTDVTDYPGPGWRPNDVVVGVDDGTSWRAGPRPCPRSALPRCTPADPDRTLVTGREPFDPTEPAPLDLVVPVASLATGGTGGELGPRTVAGREAVGAEVSVAQLAPLLDALTAAGNWRPLHPTDRAEVWVDAATGVPLAVTVRASDTVRRAQWAATLGYDDPAGAELLALSLSEVTLGSEADDTDDAVAPPAADGWQRVDRGFRDGGADAPAPAWLPDGMTLHRTGRVGDVTVASWSDGRAWLTVRSTRTWTADRLFGAPAGPVERIRVGDGVGYVSSTGTVHLHGRDQDLQVAGSVGLDDLRRVAAGLGVTGLPVPAGWAEAPASTLEAAGEALPGLRVPQPAGGFRGPAVAVEGDVVSLGYVGGGVRSFVLTQHPGEVLRPPLDDVVLGVEVDGVAGRFTPARGELEWVRDGIVHVLGSDSLSLEELLGIAAGLRPAGPS